MERKLFQRYQQVLLFLCNSSLTRFWFRWVLRIHNDIPWYKDITQLTPSCYSWRDKGSTVTDFRTHNKFAKRIYYALSPLWYLLHFWDWLSSPVPEWNLGFDTLTAYSNVGSSQQWADGQVQASKIGTPTDVSFGTLRVGLDPLIRSVNNGASSITPILQTSSTGTSPNFNVLVRGYMNFNTEFLPYNANISNAVISLWGTQKTQILGQPDLYICGSTAGNPLTVNHYTSWLPTLFSSITYAAYNDGGTYNAFTLNQNGINAVDNCNLNRLAEISNAVAGAGIVTITTIDEFHLLDSVVDRADLSDSIVISGVVGMTDLNSTFSVTVTGDNTFTVPLSTSQTYESGGLISVSAGYAVSKFAALLSWDFTGVDTVPVSNWSAGKGSSFTFRSADWVGSGNDPKLVITYTAPPPVQGTLNSTLDAFTFSANDNFLGWGTIYQEQIEDWVRIRTHTELEDRLTEQMFIDWTNWAVQSLVPKLGRNQFYISTSVLGVGTSFSLSSLKMRGIERVVDSNNGLIHPIDSDGFERVTNSLTTNSAFWVQEGETLRISYGSGLTPGTLTLYYYRVPNLVDSRSDVLDIENSHIGYVLQHLVKQVEEWKRAA